MRSSVSSNVVVAGIAAAIVSAVGCTGAEVGDDPNPFLTQNMAGAGQGQAGTPGASGATGSSGSSPGGASGVAGTPGGGAGPTAGTSAGGASGSAGAAGVGGGAVGPDITKVVPTAGCGKPFAGQSGAKVTIPTMGMKDANCAAKLGGVSKCGAWQTPRDYYVYLPAAYDMSRAYPLVLEGPGCGGNGTQIYPLDPDGNGAQASSVDNTVIRVGLTPGPNSLGHGTNENQGCFDDKEGDDSIDWVFYENLYDKLSQEVCFDRNRVYSAGNSSGSWFSNELGCKYAGNTMRPVRGVMPNTGGLPTEAQFVPTCSNAPMAGMWVHEINDGTNGFAGNKVAIARAMSHNKCTIGTNYDNTMFEDFPIGGGQGASVCKRIKGCDPLYPLVVCPLNGNGHGSHDEVVNPGFSTFLKMFSTGAFVTQ